MGSLTTLSPIDRLIYGFTGSDAHNLTTVCVPSAAFESSWPYNILDDAAAICAGLDTLPQDQLYHSYVIAGMLDMMTSTCKCAIMLLTQWYGQLAEHFLDGIEIKDFYDRFLATVNMTEQQALQDVFTWWRHTTSRHQERNPSLSTHF